jgi:hypothetical protein
MAVSDTGKALRPTLRTLALVGYGLLCLLFVLPGGSRFTSRAVWNSAHNQRQFDDWARSLGSLGIRTSGTRLQAELWSFAKTYSRDRDKLLRPLRWLPEQVGFGQSWRMFSNPQTTPSQLWVEMDTGSGFSPIYVSRSNDHTWRRSLFDHHRVRKLLGRIGRGGKDEAYVALSARVAKHAFADFPNAKRVRTRIFTWATPPANTSAPQPEQLCRGTFRHERTFNRETSP